ncbi:MAG TPA: aminotransferase class IV [Pseudolysinimonas sp.]|nr:aminotransferase class IV [Pseudolysinimonas sp.]
MSAATTFVWRGTSSESGGGALEPELRDLDSSRILAADSWLVDAGRVRALELHRRRFLDAVSKSTAGRSSVASEPAVDAAELAPEAFWDAAIAALPRTGTWFPRVELVDAGPSDAPDPQMRLLLRPAPDRGRSVTVATHSGPDPRRSPRIKGPDIVALSHLRDAAKKRRVDELVILTPEGRIAEGTTTCFAWWNGDVLVTPSPEIERIDSVTLRSLQAVAIALGTAVETDGARPDDLEGHEVWALNALHGIRIVTAWLGGPVVAEEPGRLARWQARLDGLRAPLP